MTMVKCGTSLLVEGLNLSLGGNPILQDINFEVSPGTVHCIIGPNGGGKTSLIRSLLGQMPHQGTIKIRWNSSSKITGYVPQALDFDLTLPMTVSDFMVMICQLRPIFAGTSTKKHAFILSALKRVGMQDKLDYQFGGLSGGERQRVLLAQALIPEPDLLILDEPASGLDKSGSEIMRSIIKELKSKGITILMIHHDLAEVREIGDTVTCINQRVLFSGSPETMLTPDKILSIYSSSKEH